jgi:CubicO group peptidase (beta-lactamase class C family)
MPKSAFVTLRFPVAVLTGVAMIVVSSGAATTIAKPEDAGLSSDRLGRIHDTMQRHIDAGDFSGAVTLVARRGRVVHLEAQGRLNLKSNAPMTTDAIFRIASMTKPITATAILMLMEEGKVRLSDPVSRFVPEFKALKVGVPLETPPAPAGARLAETPFYTMPAAREITIHDLLTHTSGLVSGGIGASEAAKNPRKPADTLADYIPQLGRLPLSFQPGSRWTYSPGAGFDTLGRVVEVASGQSFDQFLRLRIFEPLGMKDTFFNAPDDRAARGAALYQRTAEGLELPANQTPPAVTKYFSGGGGLMSTAEDYIQFAQMLLNRGQLNGKRLLGPRTVDLMAAVHVPDTVPGRAPGRGFGLSVQVVSNAVAAGYRVSNNSYGWDGAFGTHFWVDPKEQIVGIMMVQTSNPNRQADRDFENAIMQAIVD